MAKNSLLLQWIALLLVPSVYLVLREELSRTLIESCGFLWGTILFIGVTITVIADIVILIIKTWGYLKPISELITELIKIIIDFFRI